METRTSIGILQVHCRSCMTQHNHHLCVASFACPEERGVAIRVNGIEVSRVLEEELDTAGVA